MTLPRLRRIQWVLRAALVFALLISMAANILHASDDPIAQSIAAWSPVALFVAIEVMMRVPIRSRLRAGLRITATTAIAGIAAWTSYWHMVGVVARYETGLVPYLLPISVDGLIIVLSVSLFDVASQIRERLDTPASDTRAAVHADNSAVLHITDAVSGPDTATTGPVPVSDPRPDAHDETDPLHDQDADEDEPDDAPSETEPDTENTPDLAPDLVPLLPAARAARAELLNEGRTVSRDALAAQLRRNGNPIRNTRASELLTVLKAEAPEVDGSRPGALAGRERAAS